MKKHLGILSAMAIGDSFGRSFEFATKDKIDPELDLTVYHPSVAKYADGYKGGTGIYTDDTQMAMAIAEHMLSGRSITHNDYAEMLLLAFNRDRRKGYSNRIQYLLENSTNADALQHNLGIQKPRNSNGCLIRCLPLGLYPDVNMVKHACLIQASLTHPTWECIIASQIMALAAHYLYYGNKKTFQLWITDHVPSSVFHHIFELYKLGQQINCDAFETASYVLNIIFRQSKFKKLVPTPTGATTTRSYNSHTYTWSTYYNLPDATLSQILRHAVAEVGGDADSTAALCMALASLKGAKNDLDIKLYNNLENGIYGRDYLMNLDKKLFERFPKIVPKPEKIKVKVETIAEKEAKEKEKEKAEKAAENSTEENSTTESETVTTPATTPVTTVKKKRKPLDGDNNISEINKGLMDDEDWNLAMMAGGYF